MSCLIKIFVKNLFLIKGMLTKFHFDRIERSSEISGKGVLHSHQQASSLMDDTFVTGQTCFHLIKLQFTMSQTISAFAL